MIDLSHIEEQIEMNRRKELLEKHPYKIWEGKNGSWYTYLPDDEKGRVLKKKISRDAIENEVINYWREKIENPSIDDIYHEWVSGKLDRGEISLATKDRYDRQYQECFSEFGKRKIRKVEELEIEDFILDSIAKHNLTAKGYSNLRTLIFGIFKRAKKKKLIAYNITQTISDIEISRKLFRQTKKPDRLLVFSEEETSRIIDYIFNTGLDILGLGIILLFKTGLRPGELAALKKEDVSGNYISVRRTEIRYRIEGHEIFEVRDFPKTEAGIRKVIIPDSCGWVISEISKKSPEGEYLFEKNGKRVKTYQFSKKLSTICKRLDIPVRSLNKIRKTYASVLIDNNIEESLVISQMGHTDIRTTRQYYYKDRHDYADKAKQINKITALQ